MSQRQSIPLRLSFLALVVISCCACPKVLAPPVDPAKYPVASPDIVIPYRISDSFDIGAKTIVLMAMQDWSRGTGYRVAWKRDNYGDGLLIAPVGSREDLPAVPRPNRQYIAVTQRAEHRIWIVMDQWMTTELLRAVAIHELGHFLGLEHRSRQTDVTMTCMTPESYEACAESENGVPILDRESYCRIHNCSAH